MKKTDAGLFTAIGFPVLFAIAYASIMYFKIKVPRYFPLEHAWAYSSSPGKIAQGWYGMFAFAFLSALIIALIGYFLLCSKKMKSTPAILNALSALSFLLIAFSLVWFILHEFLKKLSFAANYFSRALIIYWLSGDFIHNFCTRRQDYIENIMLLTAGFKAILLASI